MKRFASLFLVLGFGVALFAGCDDNKSDGDGDIDEHGSQYPSCDAIIEACHPVDTGEEGAIHSCHEYAEDASNNEVCVPEEDRCVTLCEGAADGGDDAGDAG